MALASTSAWAQDQTDTPGVKTSVVDIVAQSGLVGFFILMLSVAALALILEHALSIRAARLMPEDLYRELETQLARRRYEQATQICLARPCFLAAVVATGLEVVRYGYDAVEKDIEEMSAEQSARLFRKIEYLSLISTIAPMLGLLGTVMGMISAFRTVSATEGTAKAPELASGIYHALITTCMGLIVAIPCAGAFIFFRNRVEQLSADTALAAERLFQPLRPTADEGSSSEYRQIRRTPPRGDEG